MQLHPETCPLCKKADEMEKRGDKGHTLRYRSETTEWVHDFINKTSMTHGYCWATALRKQNG